MWEVIEIKENAYLLEIIKSIDPSYRIRDICICRNEAESWDTIWRWLWFTRRIWIKHIWEEVEKSLQPLFPILYELNINSILDSTCGLGFKTIAFAKRNYDVEGSDQSRIAIEYASILAREYGFRIRFFHSRLSELCGKCMRRYDCVYSDYFDELRTYSDLKASAKGVYSVLNENGKFMFHSLSPRVERMFLKKLIEKEWHRRENSV